MEAEMASQHDNVTPLWPTRRQIEIAQQYRRAAEAPVDYVRRPGDIMPTHYRGQRIYSGDQLIWACFFTGVGCIAFTLGAAFVWSFFL
jgi:uncharacterized membrane protein